jgi:hypothetical protein
VVPLLALVSPVLLEASLALLHQALLEEVPLVCSKLFPFLNIY